MARDDAERLKSELEELFADLCQVPRLVAQRAGFRPNVDVYRTSEPRAVTVVVELAGVDPAQVELSLADGALVVRGTRRRELERQRVYQNMEIDYGRFERRVQLDDPIDPEGVEARYERGLLTVVLPLAPRPSRRVRVRITTTTVS